MGYSTFRLIVLEQDSLIFENTVEALGGCFVAVRFLLL
jgi:hypothetical protein